MQSAAARSTLGDPAPRGLRASSRAMDRRRAVEALEVAKTRLQPADRGTTGGTPPGGARPAPTPWRPRGEPRGGAGRLIVTDDADAAAVVRDRRRPVPGPARRVGRTPALVARSLAGRTGWQRCPPTSPRSARRAHRRPAPRRPAARAASSPTPAAPAPRCSPRCQGSRSSPRSDRARPPPTPAAPRADRPVAGAAARRRHRRRPRRPPGLAWAPRPRGLLGTRVYLGHGLTP